METSVRRLHKELTDIKNGTMKTFRNIEVDESDINTWTGLLIPQNPPFNKGAFKIEIKFPTEYPFKPPNITFITKIYHPNVDDNGQVCLPIISPENWKPVVRAEQVIEALIALINEPQTDHPLRESIAEEYVKHKKKFMKRAEDFTKKHAEKRPSD